MCRKCCYNCTIDVSPVWRQARDLGVTLCNACHICWTTKGIHRAKPSLEELARTKAAAQNKKVAPMAQSSKAVDVSARSGHGTLEAMVGGKRKRVAKNWGEDQECYGEGTLGELTPFSSHPHYLSFTVALSPCTLNALRGKRHCMHL